MTTAPIAPAAGQSSAIIDYLDDIAEPAIVDTLSDITRVGIHRYLGLWDRIGWFQTSSRFFIDGEQLRFINQIATTLAISDLIGRARIQAQADAELRDHPDDYTAFNEQESLLWTTEQLRKLFTPREALAFFRKIAGLTGPAVDNASLFETLMTGRAFSIAVTADTVIRERVARVIEQRIETGKDVRGAGRVIDEILDESGVAHANGYGAMVARTNTMEAYNSGAWSRFKDPDLDVLMPVWEYIGIRDGRQRQGPLPEKPDHRAKCKKYWPRSMNFQDVRGREARDVINCRCSFSAKTKRQWVRLQAGGARLESVPIPTWPTG